MMLSYAFYREVRVIDHNDIILLRYPGADFFLNTAFRLLGRRIFVFEHNTKELNELKLRKSGSYWFAYLYRMEKKYGSSLRSMASALVAVTSDFLDYQRQTYKCQVTGRVISNGYSVTGTKKRVLRRSRAGIHFLMLIGSFAEWHGLEIFARALAEAQNESYYLHVVGNVPEETVSRIVNNKRNIIFYGEKDLNSRQAIAEECHIGVGALGLGKLDVQTGSSLKVREYLALGMPVIISVNDEDVHEEAFHEKYAMRICVENDSFDLQGVVEFFGTKIYEQQHTDRIREYARRNVDYSVKAMQYLELFKYLKAENKKQD